MDHFLIFPLFFLHETFNDFFTTIPSPQQSFKNVTSLEFVFFFIFVMTSFDSGLTPHQALKKHHNYRKGRLGISFSSQQPPRWIECSVCCVFLPHNHNKNNNNNNINDTNERVGMCEYLHGPFVRSVHLPVRADASGQMWSSPCLSCNVTFATFTLLLFLRLLFLVTLHFPQPSYQVKNVLLQTFW